MSFNISTHTHTHCRPLLTLSFLWPLGHLSSLAPGHMASSSILKNLLPGTHWLHYGKGFLEWCLCTHGVFPNFLAEVHGQS